MKNLLLYWLLLFILMAMLGCSKDDNPSSPGTPAENEVLIQNLAFNPSVKMVAQGTTIKWINKDGAIHTVTSGTPGNPNGVFDSGNLGNNAEFSFTFNQKGTFQYYCRLHSNMTASIVVQ